MSPTRPIRRCSRLVRRALLAAAMLLPAARAGAQTATQTVTYSVSAINLMSVSGSPGALNITASNATAGVDSAYVTDATTTYALTTNETSRKITAAINTAMPSNTKLEVSLAAPSGATVKGWQTLSTTAVDVVGAISTLSASSLGISFRFTAHTAAGAVNSASKTVTYTITTGP